MRPPEEIDAGAVVLRRWREDEAAALAAAVTASLPELRVFLPWATDEYDVASARDFLRACVRQWDDGTDFTYGLHTRAGGVVGSAGLMTRLGPGVLEIGYWVHSAHTGHGIATAAAEALAHVGLRLASRVVIRHEAANAASARVAARAGFRRRREAPPGESLCPSGAPAIVWELHRPPADEVS